MTTCTFDLDGKLLVSGPMQGKYSSLPNPTDFSRFATEEKGCYGFEPEWGDNPIAEAPYYSGQGGLVYFDMMTKPDLAALFRVLGVVEYGTVNSDRQYAVFTQVADSPGSERYLVQMRLVSRFALRYHYHALSDRAYEQFPQQPLTLADACWEFISFHQKRWGEHSYENTGKGLAGLFGGDGFFEREYLSFGFLVENSYYNIYRIWSRAYLVTK